MALSGRYVCDALAVAGDHGAVGGVGVVKKLTDASAVLPAVAPSAAGPATTLSPRPVRGLSLGWEFAVAVAAYAAVSVAYDVRLRREPVFDLAAVASGFVIRAIAGGLATGVPLSEWFLVVISAASLFVVAGKREPATVGMG